MIRRRWQETHGKDPLFAAVDGSNCPGLPQSEEKITLPAAQAGSVPSLAALAADHRAGWQPGPNPEFTIEVVRDPTGCNTDPKYGLNSSDPHISVYRRPRVVANLKYLAVDAGAQIFGAAGPFNAKRLGMVMDRDPATGAYSAMNIMSDAREPSLAMQARDASVDHLQARQPLTRTQQLQSIVKFESQVYAAQGSDLWGDDFAAAGAPAALGARNLQQSPSGVLGDNFGNPAFKSFATWTAATAASGTGQVIFRDSVIRGYDVFFNRPFWIRDVTHINTVGLGNPAKRTCVTCHNLQMVGTDASAGWGDLGTMNLSPGPTRRFPHRRMTRRSPSCRCSKWCARRRRAHILSWDGSSSPTIRDAPSFPANVMTWAPSSWGSCGPWRHAPRTSPAARRRTCVPLWISMIGASTSGLLGAGAHRPRQLPVGAVVDAILGCCGRAGPCNRGARRCGGSCRAAQLHRLSGAAGHRYRTVLACAVPGRTLLPGHSD